MTSLVTSLSVPDIASPQARSRRSKFWLICLALAIIGLFTVNGIITSVAIMVLPVLGFLLWREGEPPVLLFGCAFQWLQATAAIFYTNNLGQTLDDAFGSHVLTTASWLSIAAVLILAIGVRCAFIGAGSTRKA